MLAVCRAIVRQRPRSLMHHTPAARALVTPVSHGVSVCKSRQSPPYHESGTGESSLTFPHTQIRVADAAKQIGPGLLLAGEPKIA